MKKNHHKTLQGETVVSCVLKKTKYKSSNNNCNVKKCIHTAKHKCLYVFKVQ